ncbi:hypothetical protein TNCV_4354541 [Trichonephila clavipes]|nr:hypothetical protein TNCV_4354541 [Trichonephila clavipes]
MTRLTTEQVPFSLHQREDFQLLYTTGFEETRFERVVGLKRLLSMTEPIGHRGIIRATKNDAEYEENADDPEGRHHSCKRDDRSEETSPVGRPFLESRLRSPSSLLTLCDHSLSLCVPRMLTHE